MQVRPHEKKNILISGFFVIILTVLMGVSVFFLGKERSVFSRKAVIYTEVSNAQNLKPGAFVQLKGIKIGTVQSIDIVELEKIRITLSIIDTHRKWIRKDSYMEFKTQGVLGDKFLEILGGSAEAEPVKNFAYITTKQTTGLQKIITKSEDIMVTATRVLQRLDLILAAIEPETLNSTLNNFNESTKSTKDILGSIKPKEVRTIVKSLSKVSKRVEAGPGTLHSLIYDRAIHDDIKAITGGANRSKMLKYFIRESIKKNEEN